MTAKRTPGPWRLQSLDRRHHGYAWHTFVIRSPQNHALAVVGDVDRATAADNEANARLIAAAPALLAALRELVELPNKQRPDHVWLAARTAIAAAEGGAP